MTRPGLDDLTGDRLAVVAELERMVLPPAETRRPGLEVAARLRGRQEALDGHWCEVLPLPAGRTALVVGDAGGRGPHAAARLFRLHAQLQALALTEPLPGRMLDLLDAAVRQEGREAREEAVGCLYAVYDPASGELRLASAGRITSVLVGPDGHAEPLDPEPSPPLGGGHPAYQTRYLNPESGSLILLGTRGLTLVGDGLLGLGPLAAPTLTEAAGLTGVASLSGLCERLLKEAGGGAVALLAARLPVPARGSAADADEAAAVRRPGRDGEFVGRATELHEVRRLLEDARLVTITGGPGIGKSRLASESAACLGRDFSDGVVRVDLTEVRSAEGVPRAVESALRDTVGVPMVDLADRQLLLVLDGYDGLLQPCTLFVRSLLRAAPRLRVLGTGRQPFGLTGEHVLPLAPLGLDAAVRLFASLAGPRPDGEDPADVRRLCARLDAVPLMVELAACVAGETDAAALTARFDALGDFAGFGDTAAADAARAAVERSHELCTEPERLLWARLSVFRGRFDLYAVEEVCVDERLSVEKTLRSLSALIDKSVVSSELGRRGRGYRLLHGVRGHGAELLAELPEHEALRARHDAWLAGSAGHDL